MATSQPSFRDREEFRRGRNGEQLVAAFLQRRGWYVIPSYDYSGEDGDKAPRLQGLANFLVIPDLDVAKDGLRRWAEVKTKKQADWTRITERLEHGFQRRHWDDYMEVQRITGCEVWLFVYEETTGEILCQSIDRLARSARFYEGRKMGRGGMVFFPRDAFITLM